LDTDLNPTRIDGKAVPAFAGVVRSYPGSTAQHWHSDSPHQELTHTKANLLTALVALEHITLDMGPTEVLPGSHRLTNHLQGRPAVTSDIVYQHSINSPELIGSSETPFCVSASKGDVMIFDDRILHRGLANISDRARSVAYISYKRSSFMDDTHFEANRSLFKLLGIDRPEE